MSKGRYIIPTVTGEAGTEVLVINRASVSSGWLLRTVCVRGVLPKDRSGIQRAIEMGRLHGASLNRVRELEPIDTCDSLTIAERSVLKGFIRGDLPGAYKAPELNGWYILERFGEVTPLRLAAFYLSMLPREDRLSMLAPFQGTVWRLNDSRLKKYHTY